MKRTVAILTVLTMALCTLAGCGVMDRDSDEKPWKDPFYGESDGRPDDSQNGGGYGDGPLILTELPEGMSGKEAASLILANQRLNAKLLQNSENIFEDGADTLRLLASMASSALAENTFAAGSDTALSGTQYKAIDGSYVVIDGNEYRWSGFAEYSTSYDYFLNLTTNITGSAEIGAQLIDDVKKYVRVVDKWVDMGGMQYYLHVEEDSETLFSRDESFVRICIRTKTEDGSNRYEVAQMSE